MELKVWVDGVVRVVCGLSQETSCQDVVIALAQAIGQTGRYVLIQKLRDTERQLLAHERPLESLAKLGQHGSEVQFFLRRTGPSSSEGPHPDRSPALPKPTEAEPPPRREPKKSLTFNLGPTSSPKVKHQARKTPRASRDVRATPSPPATATPSASMSKEEVFRLILQQQARLQSLDTQLEVVEGEEHAWERLSGPELQLHEELERLDQVARRNDTELSHEATWKEELLVEAERERGLRRHLAELRSSLDDCGRQLHNCSARSAQLAGDIQQEAHRGESLSAVRAELHSQDQQGAALDASLTEMEEALRRAEARLQENNEEIDNLNKELRQCNLQQFIQQTGVPPAPSPTRTEVLEQPEQVEQPATAKLQQDAYSNGGPGPYPLESPPRPTAKHFLGNPRNLQNPLVSSLNPEVLTSRESSWR